MDRNCHDRQSWSLPRRVLRAALDLCGNAVRRIRTLGWRPALIGLYVYFGNMVLRAYNRLPLAARFECPCCGWRGRRYLFHDVIGYYKTDSVCPDCRAHEKHRWFFLFFQRKLASIPPDGSVVHFAPEPWVSSMLRPKLGRRYVTADLCESSVDLKADLAAIPLRTAAASSLIVFNVLDYVRRDLVALGEMRRVLGCEGVLYLHVPLRAGGKPTLQYSCPDPLDSLHIRKYGLDILELFRKSGFRTALVTPRSMFDRDEIQRYGLNRDGIFECFPA
ncbi:MAG: hypothetical protein RDV41_08490 [Planctomycetota bacterium]|nr:hypothetical protein [Planctomycetota bacterium]